MRQRTKRILRIIGALILSALLIYWLFVATDLNETEETDYELVEPAAQ